MFSEKTIYILLTDTGTILTRMIKSYTKKPYNHASIAFDAELFEIYSFGRKTAKNPFMGGFVREDIHSILFKQANCAIYSLTIPNNEFQKMHQYIQEIAAQKEHYRYNFIGLFGVPFKTPIKRKNAFFCSQFVASVLTESKIIGFEKDLSLVEPSDLPHSANFQLIFEGRLRDYHQRDKNKRDSILVIPL
ncbi:hypothetical protein [Psychrobacillus lasiicapitis]|uniref:Uncharacterized protein n=1 Tax=Psychrobacillus lasiicapitis TaxID=1636719 RepID=A0A544T4P7_9BACI|nr:hypothetical protein [Psychrobacillus lasiicapitis]TQR12411.1 hypothetical protein FG382_12320 [Psychrobacillus lasiicapitis]GGA37881.1 hypothetical protein GCM10011384_29270 [Psychrobacillus lasiicapitis]